MLSGAVVDHSEEGAALAAAEGVGAEAELDEGQAEQDEEDHFSREVVADHGEGQEELHHAQEDEREVLLHDQPPASFGVEGVVAPASGQDGAHHRAHEEVEDDVLRRRGKPRRTLGKEGSAEEPDDHPADLEPALSAVELG